MPGWHPSILLRVKKISNILVDFQSSVRCKYVSDLSAMASFFV